MSLGVCFYCGFEIIICSFGKKNKQTNVAEQLEGVRLMQVKNTSIWNQQWQDGKTGEEIWEQVVTGDRYFKY